MKTQSLTLKLACFAATFCATLSVASATNIVVDGGFELSPAPDFSSAWALNEPNGFSDVGTNPLFANSGLQHANLAPDYGATGSLSQILNTTIGASYTFSFFLANDVESDDSLFVALFDNVSVFMTNTTLFGTSGDYTEFTFSNLIATSAFTTIEFQYRHDDDFWRLDDISVNAAPGVPEGGSSLAILGVGLLAVEGLRRKFCSSAT